MQQSFARHVCDRTSEQLRDCLHGRMLPTSHHHRVALATYNVHGQLLDHMQTPSCDLAAKAEFTTVVLWPHAVSLPQEGALATYNELSGLVDQLFEDDVVRREVQVRVMVEDLQFGRGAGGRELWGLQWVGQGRSGEIPEAEVRLEVQLRLGSVGSCAWSLLHFAVTRSKAFTASRLPPARSGRRGAQSTSTCNFQVINCQICKLRIAIQILPLGPSGRRGAEAAW